MNGDRCGSYRYDDAVLRHRISSRYSTRITVGYGIVGFRLNGVYHGASYTDNSSACRSGYRHSYYKHNMSGILVGFPEWCNARQ